VIIEKTAFDQKAYRLCNSSDTVARIIAKVYFLQIRLNADCCRILTPDQTVELPDHLAQAVKADDHYLVQAMLNSGGTILVTTDAPLRQVLENNGLSCLSPEQLLSVYFPRNN
jgi:hypothetical protein